MSLTEDEVARLDEILAAVGEIKNKLRKWDHDFISDIEKQYDEKEGELFLTGKQWAQLERIYGLA